MLFTADTMSVVTSAQITVRPARSSDATAISAIEHNPSRESEIRHAAKGSRCLVAELNGIIAGFAVGSRLYGFDFLELLVVSVTHRRRGVGSALMRGWEATADTPKLFTSTNDSNIPMQRLCERLGYARSGLIENLDEGDPEIIYFRSNPSCSACRLSRRCSRHPHAGSRASRIRSSACPSRRIRDVER